MILKNLSRRSLLQRLLIATMVCALLLSLVSAAVPFSVTGILSYQVTVSGGGHGQISYGDIIGGSQTFDVLDGSTLPDGIKVIPDKGYTLNGFTFSAKIKHICTGREHTVVLTDDGKVYASGSNARGQLGMGDNLNRTVFTEVTSLRGKTITDIAAGENFTAALTTDGRLLVTGDNSLGQLGMGDIDKYNTFTEVTSLIGKNIFTIAAGASHMVVAALDGTLYAAGNNSSGQLGTSDTGLKRSFAEVTSLKGKTLTSIVAGSLHTFVVTTDGLYATGYNERGQLGLGDTNKHTSFTEVTSLTGKTVVDVAAGAYHSAVVTSDGSLYVAGWNRYAQLGFPRDIEIYNNFIMATDLAGKTVTAVMAGDYNTVALTSDGGVYNTGLCFNKEMGVDSYAPSIFTQVPSLKEKNVVGMDIGYGHSVVALSEGNLYAVGDNSYGQCGLGSVTKQDAYTLITNTPWVRPISSLSEIPVNCNIIAAAVYKNITTLALSAAPVNALYPQNIVLTATLSGMDAASDKTVVFYSGDNLLGSTLTDASGKAVYTITSPNVGSYSFKAAFAGDSTNTSAQSNTVSYSVGPGDQAMLILSGIPANITYGDNPFTVSISGGSGDSVVTYVSSNTAVASVDNSGKVTIVGAGNFTITAKKAASENYKEASVTSAEISVNKKALTTADLNYTGPSSLVYNGSAKTADVEAKDGLTGIGTVSVKYYNGATEVSEAVNAGTYTVKVDVTDSTNCSGVSNLEVGSFTIIKASQNKPDKLFEINPTNLANVDGKITGVDSSMEYQKRGENGWKAVIGTQITGLSDGTYLVRYVAGLNYNEGEAAELILTKYTGTQETTPRVSFDAATRTLSCTETGQRYRIDGSPWTEVKSDLSKEITKACIIELYMPGDGVYTLDSGIQTIAVTKAEKPTVTGENETFQGKNDGKISGMDTTMEYKAGDGPWTDIISQTVDGLLPGTYYVRVKASSTSLESDVAEIIITAGEPEFSERTIEDDTKKAMVIGQLTKDAELHMVSVSASSTSYNRLIRLVDTDKNDVIGVFEINIISGEYSGEMKLVFNVGNNYNGKKLTIYHETKSGNVEQYTAICIDGKVSLTVDEFSPFLITATANTDSDLPQTGDSGALLSWLILAVLSAEIALVLGVVRRRKTRKL